MLASADRPAICSELIEGGGGSPISTFVRFWDFAVFDGVRQDIGLIASLDAGQDLKDVAPAVVQTVADATYS